LVLGSTFVQAATPTVSSLFQQYTGVSPRISTCSQLKATVRNLSGTYILVNDIDCAGSDFTPIGTTSKPFTGTLNGNGFEIKNVNVPTSMSFSSMGMFVSSPNAVFKNLRINNLTTRFGSKHSAYKQEPSLAPFGNYGRRVIVEGTTALVADPLDSDFGLNSGAIFVYELINNVWKFSAKLYAMAPKTLDYFGADMALQADRLIVTNGTYDSDLGIVIFQRKDKKWIQETEIPLPGAYKVAFDGNTIAIGQPDLNKVQLLTFNRTEWVLGQEITIPDEIKNTGTYRFGENVVMKSNLMVIGSPGGYPQEEGEYGRVAVYAKVNGQWALQRVVVGNQFAFGEALGMDGSTVVLGDDHGVRTFDAANPTSELLTIADDQGDFKNRMIGANVKIHNNVVAFTVQPHPFASEPLPAEAVVFYKRMEDNKWRRILTREAMFTPQLGEGVMHIGLYGAGIDFTDTDVFIGIPNYDADTGAPREAHRGTLSYYSTQNNIEYVWN
jgi:hypothetical protein